MNTADLMQIALDLGGFPEIPADSGIWVEGDHLRRVLIGLDVGTAELLMARQLGFDAVVAHHPVQRRGFWKVFERHWELMRAAGLPDDAIRAAIETRSAGMRLAEHNTNDDHVVSVARLLGMPFLNCHLPLDEYTRRVLIRTVAECQQANPNATAGQVAEAIGQLPSFERSWLKPLVAHGSADAPAGRVVASIASGTNGGYSVAEAYLTHGVDTVIYMHIQPEDRERLRREGVRGNLIITGHAPADSIGVDAFVQALRRRGLEVETFSGVDTPVEG
jgi:putative NIF3 family GTP cyclohydrolase 1 type 2